VEALNIILLTFGILAVVFGATFLVLRQMRVRGEQEVRTRYPNAKLVIPSAVFFGQQSKGVGQLRGNGTLAITDREVYFRKWVSPTEHIIPIARIEAIESPRAFLGKSYGRPLLKLNYRRDDGQPDSIAWYVPNLEAAASQIEALRP
jgi:hypothetical protein